MRRLVQTVLALAALGTASGGTIDVPSDFSTIQQAIDAAASGDTVRIKAGTYFENLVVMGKAVHLKGSGAVIVDGLSGGVAHGPVVWLKTGADGSSVRNLTLRHGRTMGLAPGHGVFAEAPSVRIEKCKILACDSVAVRMTRDLCTVRKCVIEGTAGGVGGGSDYAVVESNVMNGLLGTGIDVSGKAPRVLKNRIERVESGKGITTSSSDTEITGNVIRGVTDDYGIEVDGSGSIVTNNTIEFGSDDDFAISVSAADAVLRGNRVRDITGVAVQLWGSGTGAVLEKNRFERTGSETESAVIVFGAGCAFVKNVLRDVDGSGINVVATNAVLMSNTIVNAHRDGVRVDLVGTGVECTGNVVKNCLGDGIDLRVTPAVFEKNVVVKNRNDVATVFPATFSPTNTIGVSGPSTVD